MIKRNKRQTKSLVELRERAFLNRTQIQIGVFILFLGISVYLVDRPPGSVYFLSNYMSLFKPTSKLFGIVGNNLPSFSHVLSFILITAGLLKGNRACSIVVCLGWCIVDCAFELGQHELINRWLADRVPEWFEWLPALENTKFYFLRGTFDPFDLLSIFLGSIIAYIIILMTDKQIRDMAHGNRK